MAQLLPLPLHRTALPGGEGAGRPAVRTGDMEAMRVVFAAAINWSFKYAISLSLSRLSASRASRSFCDDKH
jgi:hypothetical protein